VPVTIEESFAYRGSPSTWGMAAIENAISPAPPSPSSPGR
jgi:hypothetical protein